MKCQQSKISFGFKLLFEHYQLTKLRSSLTTPLPSPPPPAPCSKDSVVSPAIAHDLVKACDEVGRGERVASDLLGEAEIDPVLAENAYGSQLARERLKGSCRHLLLCRYKNRATDAEVEGEVEGAAGRRARAYSRSQSAGAADGM